METVFLKLLNMSITASWLVLAAIALRLVFKKAPKWITGILWGFVALRLVFPFSFESILSLVPSAETVVQDTGMVSAPSIHSGFSTLNSAVNPILSSALAPDPISSVDPMQVVTSVVSIVWVVGVAAMLIYALVSFIGIRRKVSEAVVYSDNVLVCDRISSPFIFGVLRPRIYLPSDLQQEDIQYVLMHERAHLKRRDYIFKPFGFLLLSVYWFNPVLWVAYILFCRDIEFACDEKVLKEMGVEIKKPYSNSLINCSVSARTITACPVAFGETGVKTRVKSILNYKKPTFWVIVLGILACAFVAVCLLTNPKTQAMEIPVGIYKMTESVYCDESYSTSEIADDMDQYRNLRVEIEKDANIYVFDRSIIETGSHYKEIKLTEDIFDSLFKTENAWADGYRDFKLGILNRKAWVTTYTVYESGIYPYMLLQKSDGELYLVYAIVSKGEPVSAKWIYKLERNWTSAADDALTVFDATVIEILDDSIVVSPDINSDEGKLADRITLELSGYSAPVMQVGDRIRAEYVGNVDVSDSGAVIQSLSALYVYADDGSFSDCTVYPEHYTNYVYYESPEPWENPSISLSDYEKEFSFSWSALSSYISHGKYELEDKLLTLKDEDGGIYVFDVLSDGSLSFRAKDSAEIPKYKYSANAKPQSPVPDGAVFRQEGRYDYDISYQYIDKTVTDIDGDGIDELCVLGYGPTSGLFTFYFEVTENGEPEYNNIFNCEHQDISFIQGKDGKVKLQGVTWDGEFSEYDITVKGDNICLSGKDGDIAYWGEQGVDSQWRNNNK